MRLITAIVALLFIGTCQPSLLLAASVFSGGHGDVGAEFDGELELHFHVEAGTIVNGGPIGADTEFAPSAIFIRVPDSVKTTRSGSLAFSNFDFVGTGIGEDLWILPQSSPGSNPFLGIDVEFDIANWTNLRWAMTGSSMPNDGEFSLWQFGQSPRVLFSTSSPNDTEGVLAGLPNSFAAAQGHDHYAWGFTKEGIYEIDFTLSGNFSGNFYTTTETFGFLVGDATAVPEPRSLALLCLGTIGFAARVRSRKKIRTKPSR